MTKITVIFTCFNRREKTLKCVQSLMMENPNLDFSFVVVDDCSSDGTQEALKGLPYSIKLIEGTGSLYWAGGMREGIRYCLENNNRTNYILFVNDDVEFFERAIEKLVGQQLNKHNSLIVGVTCDNEGNLTYGCMICSRRKYAGLFENVGIEFAGKVDSFNMNCVLVPYNVFLKLGNFDEKYKHSLADLDYGLRASKLGYEIYSSTEFVGVCTTNTSKGKWTDRSLTRIERLKKKESPKGSPFKPWFHFLMKNFNLLTAVKYSISPYVKILLGK